MSNPEKWREYKDIPGVKEFLKKVLPEIEDQCLKHKGSQRGPQVQKTDKNGKNAKLTDIVRIETQDSPEKYGFTLVTRHRSYQFSSKDQFQRDVLVRALEALQGTEHHEDDPFKNYIRSVWNTVDSDRSNELDKTELAKVMALMNITCSQNDLDDHLESVDKDRSGKMDEEEFEECMKKLFNRRPEILDLLAQRGVTVNNGKVPLKQVHEWFRSLQQEAADEAKIAEIALGAGGAGHGHHVSELEVLHIGLLLDSPYNSIWHPHVRDRSALPGYMDQPLSHYWINSSHNTYLTGDQLAGISSAEQYRHVLKGGCRCVEIDCWDGSPGDKGDGKEPIVTHGHTVCSKILFKEVIQAIADSAFAHGNPYPVILSIEMHCSDPFQLKMHDHCKQLLGDSLWIPDPTAHAKALPSPEQLKHKILIKGTKAAPQEEADDADSDSDEEPAGDGAGVKVVKSKSTVSKATASFWSGEAKKHKSKINAQWSTLIGLSATKFKGLDQPGMAYEMSSFAEAKARKLCDPAVVDGFLKYNRTQLSRVYPFGGRVDSSNLEPLPGWAGGCQLVALNFQSYDVPMQLNAGRFAVNGGCGYVLKPDYMLRESSRPVEAKLRVKALSCQRLPGQRGGSSDIVDPYVVIEVHEVGAGPGKYRTKTEQNNGFNPVFKDEPLDCVVKDPATAILRIAVYDDDLGQDRLIGQASIPVDAIRTGVRHVPLTDPTAKPVPHAGVLVHIEAEPALLRPPRAPFTRPEL